MPSGGFLLGKREKVKGKSRGNGLLPRVRIGNWKKRGSAASTFAFSLLPFACRGASVLLRYVRVATKKRRLIPYWLRGHEVVCVACEQTHAHAVDARCVACDQSVCTTCRVDAAGGIHCPECEPRARRKR
jgi:hypothetical protein